MAAKQNVPIHELLTENMIDFYVGAKRKRYHWHRKLVCHFSRYLNDLFNGTKTEAAKSELYLTEHSPETFDLLASWLYRGTLAPIGISTTDHVCEAYVHLFALAEEWQMHTLHCLVMKLIHQFFRESRLFASTTLIKTAYESTVEPSPIRVFLAAQAAHQLSSHRVYLDDHWREKLNVHCDFKTDVLECLIVEMENRVTVQDPAFEPDSLYDR
ncbi:MAG: hypothetical protein M1830_004328 [Pleopsidium flavum]|nr:MAG: hypothetical protein M1830_004328 [Pleopsidium flavum]